MSELMRIMGIVICVMLWIGDVFLLIFGTFCLGCTVQNALAFRKARNPEKKQEKKESGIIYAFFTIIAFLLAFALAVGSLIIIRGM